MQKSIPPPLIHVSLLKSKILRGKERNAAEDTRQDSPLNLSFRRTKSPNNGLQNTEKEIVSHTQFETENFDDVCCSLAQNPPVIISNDDEQLLSHLPKENFVHEWSRSSEDDCMIDAFMKARVRYSTSLKQSLFVPITGHVQCNEMTNRVEKYKKDRISSEHIEHRYPGFNDFHEIHPRYLCTEPDGTACLSRRNVSPNLKEGSFHVHKMEEKSQRDPEETPSVEFECDQCGACYHHRFELNRHVKVSHVRPHRCQYCGKGFGHKNYLRVHIDTVHLGKKSHKCEYCGKHLSTGGNLSVHIRTIHMGEKKYSCPVCSRTFGQQCNMKTHLRRHYISSGILTKKGNGNE